MDYQAILGVLLLAGVCALGKFIGRGGFSGHDRLNDDPFRSIPPIRKLA